MHELKPAKSRCSACSCISIHVIARALFWPIWRAPLALKKRREALAYTAMLGRLMQHLIIVLLLCKEASSAATYPVILPVHCGKACHQEPTWLANMDSNVHVLVTEDVCCPAKSTAMSMPVISSSVVYLPLNAILYLLSMNTCIELRCCRSGYLTRNVSHNCWLPQFGLLRLCQAQLSLGREEGERRKGG